MSEELESSARDAPQESPLRVLRHSDFRKLWIGSVTSAAGASVGGIIITWLVYNSTHSPLIISLLGIVQFLPTLAFGLIAGALIDRLDRRRLMFTCDVARALTFGSVVVFVLFYGINVWILMVAVLTVATFSTVFRPATNAAIPRLLGPSEVTDGNGLLQGGSTIAQFVGSPIGGLLLVTLGAVVGLVFNALTFAISGTMIFLMIIPSAASKGPKREQSKNPLMKDVAEGLRYLRSQRPLFIITMTAMAANFFFTIWGAFTVFYAADKLHQGATGFALLVAANTAGFALGALLPGRLHTDRNPGRWLQATWGFDGLAIIALSLTSSLYLAIGLTILAGSLLSIGNTTWLSGVQRTVPDEMLGRYFATDEAGSFAMMPAGTAIGGFLVLWFGISWTYAIAGIGAMVVNLPLILSPTIRRWGSEKKPSRPTPALQ